LVLTLLAAGCGPQFGDVSGTVRYKGEPLKTGTITFYDQANGVASSAIQADGTYAVRKVRAGPAKIAVAMPTEISFLRPGGSVAGLAPAPALPAAPSFPPKYQDPEQSGLTFEVQPGAQEFEVRLD
jgi:hypothetical protein